VGAHLYAYASALAAGDVATCRTLRRLGIPWEPPVDVLSRAVASRHACTAVLAWLATQGCPLDWPAALAEAERSDHAAVAAWVAERAARAAAEQPGRCC
jgi:hypothetical protein